MFVTQPSRCGGGNIQYRYFGKAVDWSHDLAEVFQRPANKSKLMALSNTAITAPVAIRSKPEGTAIVFAYFQLDKAKTTGDGPAPKRRYRQASMLIGVAAAQFCDDRSCQFRPAAGRWFIHTYSRQTCSVEIVR